MTFLYNEETKSIKPQLQEPCNYCGNTVRQQSQGCNEISCYRQHLKTEYPAPSGFIEDGKELVMGKNFELKELRGEEMPKDFKYSNDKYWCDECCNGDRCDDNTHLNRKYCPYCKGTGTRNFNSIAVPISPASPISQEGEGDDHIYSNGTITHTKTGRSYKLDTPHEFINGQKVVEGKDWESGTKPYTSQTVAYATKVPTNWKESICPNCKNNQTSPNYNCELCNGVGYLPAFPTQAEDEKGAIDWLKRIQPSFDTPESYQHGFHDAIEVVLNGLPAYYHRPSSTTPASKEGELFKDLIYEQDIPTDITQEQYNEWYKTSHIIDGVRMGQPFTPAHKEQD